MWFPRNMTSFKTAEIYTVDIKRFRVAGLQGYEKNPWRIFSTFNGTQKPTIFKCTTSRKHFFGEAEETITITGLHTP